MEYPLWSVHEDGRTRADYAEAQAAYDAGIPLTPRQWVVLVWDWTGIPTCLHSPITKESPRGKIVAYSGRVEYGEYYRIANRGTRWYEAAAGEMPRWCTYLEQPYLARALRAAGALAPGTDIDDRQAILEIVRSFRTIGDVKPRELISVQRLPTGRLPK